MFVNTKFRLNAALLMLTGLASATAAGASSPARHYMPPPDSYLQYSVYSVSQLVQEVQDNPLVRRRYAQQFQIPESQVGAYLRRNLVESWVPQTGTYSVYCVNRAGKIFTVRQTFRKGTKVFALRNGEPVMKWICGNPLMRYHADLAMGNIVRQKISPSIQALTPADIAPTVGVVVPGETAALPTLVSLPLRAGGSSVFPSAARALCALPLLGFLSHNGGGGGTTPLVPRTPPSVPEPAAPVLLLAALPLSALAVARRRAGTSRS